MKIDNHESSSPLRRATPFNHTVMSGGGMYFVYPRCLLNYHVVKLLIFS